MTYTALTGTLFSEPYTQIKKLCQVIFCDGGENKFPLAEGCA
jgi:hypothetical protein